MNFSNLKSKITEAYIFINKSLFFSLIDSKSFNQYFQIKFKLKYLLLFLITFFVFLFVFVMYFLIFSPTSNASTKKLKAENISVSKKVIELEIKVDLYVSQVNKLRSIINSVNGNSSTNINSDETSFSVPVKGYLTEKFGLAHPFLDITSERGKKIKTIAPGYVVFSETSVETGKTLVIQHNNNLISIYKHCENIYVKPGNVLKKYQPIASVGNSGKLSTGYHLHLEIWQNGKPINPEKVINFK